MLEKEQCWTITDASERILAEKGIGARDEQVLEKRLII